MGDRKLIGCCTACDEPVFEVAARWTEGPYRGEIKQVGQPLDGARRVRIVRASGRQSDWTFCEGCFIDALNLPLLRKKELNAMVFERNFVVETVAQSEQRGKMLRLFEWDIPIGVLGEMPWTEVR